MSTLFSVLLHVKQKWNEGERRKETANRTAWKSALHQHEFTLTAYSLKCVFHGKSTFFSSENNQQSAEHDELPQPGTSLLNNDLDDCGKSFVSSRFLFDLYFSVQILLLTPPSSFPSSFLSIHFSVLFFFSVTSFHPSLLCFLLTLLLPFFLLFFLLLMFFLYDDDIIIIIVVVLVKVILRTSVGFSVDNQLDRLELWSVLQHIRPIFLLRFSG